MSANDRPAPEFARSTEELLGAFGVDACRGLTAEKVASIRERDGWNELASAPGDPLWKRFLGQFSDVVVWILLAAAVISGAMGEWTDTAAISAIVLLNAVLGFFQEERAERALAALQSLAAPMTKVLRDGSLTTIPTRELVAGDIVELKAGDSVPADVRLLKAFVFRVQEASLTGESVPVDKQADVILSAETPLADRRNMAYMSTVVANGTGRGIVTATGMQYDFVFSRLRADTQECPREVFPRTRRS